MAPEGAPLWPIQLGLLAVASIWGFNFIAIKIILATVNPVALACLRFGCLAGFAFWILARSGLHGERRFTRRDLTLVAASGLCGYWINPLVFSLGLDHTSAFSSAVLSGTTPVFAAVGLGLFRLEPVRARQWVGTLIALAGVTLFVSQGAHLGFAVGDLLSLASAASWAAYTVINKPLLARYGVTRVVAASLAAGSLPLVATSLPAVLAQPWGRVPAATWAWIAFTVVFSIIIAQTLYNLAIARLGVGRTVPFSYLQPILAGVFSALLLGESFGVAKVLGAAAVLAGLGLTALPVRRVRSSTV